MRERNLAKASSSSSKKKKGKKENKKRKEEENKKLALSTLLSPNPTTSTRLPANRAHDPSLALSCDECSTSPRNADDWSPFARAAAARGGIYGNDPEEATYPITRSDSESNALDGSEHAYTLTFAAGQFPPVNAFWSITMYDSKAQLLVENPIGRYLINSPMLPSLKNNPDGSLTIYIQNKSPGADRQSNWLPAPNGPIYLVMRLYWPRTTAPSILPPGAGSWKPPGVKRVS